MTSEEKIMEYTSLSDAITSLYGEGVSVASKMTLHGGDCNDAYMLTLTNDVRIFMKSNDIENEIFFRTEEHGLKEIAKTKTIPVPGVLARGTDKETRTAFLLLSFVNVGKKKRSFFEDFGRALARMHLFDVTGLVAGGPFGFYEDNIIGFRPQINTPHASWISFYRDCRLTPQIEDAKKAGYLSDDDLKRWEKLSGHLDTLLIEPEAPSLVHGDLWGGNYMTDENGNAVLIDPAVYVGHREADLAMTELFGRFPADFYRAYRETYPLQEGYEKRRDLYHLYQMLNHLNQFGVSYLSSVRRILRLYTKD